MDALLTAPRRRLPAIPGGTCGDARFGIWLMACGGEYRQDVKPSRVSLKASRTAAASGEPNSSNIRKAS